MTPYNSASKAQILQLDHKYQQRGVPLASQLRKSLFSLPKLALTTALLGGLLASSLQAKEPNQGIQTIQKTQEGSSKSLKTFLLAERIHEAFLAEHILLGSFNSTPKKYMPIPGYVDPHNYLEDTRIGANGRLEQNILQPASQLAPALLQDLTGPYASAILKTIGRKTKEQSNLWPQNRDAMSQEILTIWNQLNQKPSELFNNLSKPEKEKYRLIADGVMYVTTIEKHIDRLDAILQTTQAEASRGESPTPQTLAERLWTIEKAERLLKSTPLKSIPHQTLQIVENNTHPKILAAAISLLQQKAPDRVM